MICHTIARFKPSNAINTALDISFNLNNITTCGDLGQINKIQNLVFLSGLD
jgi:hypothetical protein